MEMAPDTIVARATAPGVGAVALVRLSGPDALGVVGALLGEGAGPLEPRVASLRPLRDPRAGELLDRAIVTFFPGPASYTGEDVVEIATHGGELVPGGVIEACAAMGARRALPGEFTQRAYLNGKLDLVQAEAIHDLIEGRSPMARRTALHQMEGGLSQRIAGIRDGLIALEALLVHHLDFPDEDDPPVSTAELAGRGDALAERLERLRSTAPEGMLLREGALAVLAGPPNAGKSSLFNAIVGSERAIVTDTPGTTRDAIEVPVSIGGFPFRLIDTAGIRSRAEKVERIGIEVALRYLSAAQVVLYCHRASEAWEPEEIAFLEGLDPARSILLLTCSDEGARGLAAGEQDPVPAGVGPLASDPVRVSAHSGQGLERLKERLAGMAFSGLRSR
ncbi:MAG: tRNA modification GTPase, partial [Gemmatimonadales bacterium]